LFQILREQHERISFFVRSKTGEIKRRLGERHRETVRIADIDVLQATSSNRFRDVIFAKAQPVYL